MALFVSEPPLVEPLTLADTKAHLKVETSDEDGLIGDLITVARSHLEQECALALITQTWRLTLDDWPPDGCILIRRAPVVSIETVSVYDAGGEAMAVDLTGMMLDRHARPARLLLDERVRPGRAINGIEVDFIAGFGADGQAVPQVLKRAMLMHVAQMYEMRGAVATSDQPGAIPEGYMRLTAAYRRRAL